MESTKHFKKLQAVTIHQAQKGNAIILGTANITILGKGGIEIQTRALCDNGSQVNLITASILQQLNENPKSDYTTFYGIGGNALGSSLGEIMLKIKLNDGSCMVNKFFVVKNITNYTPRTASSNWSHLKGKLADENFNRPGKINALLGVGIWIRIIEPGVIRSQTSMAIAHKTKLGYVILENEKDPYQTQEPCIGSVLKGASVKKLMELMENLWKIEEPQPFIKRTKEEELCEEIFATQHSRDSHGRYIVRMPFNTQVKLLGKSKQMAIRQFFAMENRMKKNQEFAEKYKLFMSEYETLGHMQEIYDNQESGYYTPHHGVLSASKFRVVFNASAKTTSGIALNEVQLVGEKLQQDLFIILMNFRQFRFGITADIERCIGKC